MPIQVGRLHDVPPHVGLTPPRRARREDGLRPEGAKFLVLVAIALLVEARRLLVGRPLGLRAAPSGWARRLAQGSPALPRVGGFFGFLFEVPEPGPGLAKRAEMLDAANNWEKERKALKMMDWS